MNQVHRTGAPVQWIQKKVSAENFVLRASYLPFSYLNIKHLLVRLSRSCAQIVQPGVTNLVDETLGGLTRIGTVV